MTNKSHDIEQTVMMLADERQAAVYRRFFKTGRGEYGEGDRFLGVTNPQVRMVVKEAWRQASMDDAERLLASQWHEVRLCGVLIMVARFEQAYRKGDMAAMSLIARRYLKLHPRINNWDLVDLSVYKIIGRYELLTGDFATMDEWISPDHTLWQRRMAIVATWMHARQGFYPKLTERAEALLSSSHDLLHKATGWMLREMYKHDERGRAALDSFLERHIAEMPSVTLSYAMERMDGEERNRWRAKRGELLMGEKGRIDGKSKIMGHKIKIISSPLDEKH